jgi:hypothetical protein
LIVEAEMKVYIASHGYDYEGSDTIGVYSTFQAARAICVARIGNDNFTISEGDGFFSATGRGQSYNVWAYEVDEVTE